MKGTQPKFSRFMKVTVWLTGLTMLLTGCTPLVPGGPGSKSNGGYSKTDPNAPLVFAAGSTMANIQARKKLIVGTTFNTPPYASQNSVTGSPEGFDIDLVQWIARGFFGSAIEGKISYIELDPRDRELALQQGKVDIVVGRYDVSAARKRFVDFAGPYFISHQAVITRNPRFVSQRIQNLVELNGRKVCVVRGSTNTDALYALLPAVDTSTVRATVAECGVQLLNSSVDAIVADTVDSASWLIAAGNNVQILDASIGPLPMGVGVKKNVGDMRQYLNDRIATWDYKTAVKTRMVGVPGDLNQPVVDRY